VKIKEMIITKIIIATSQAAGVVAGPMEQCRRLVFRLL
jgi:hypothetical protein